MGERTRELATLLLGDILLFFVALWCTLLVRYLEVPSRETLELHFWPFFILSVGWLVVYASAGLYDKQTMVLKSRLTRLIIHTQIFNIILAAFFFFVFTDFGIAPKTNLAIYLVVSSVLMIVWRIFVFPLLLPRRRQKALLIADGQEAEELVAEVNTNPRYSFEFVRIVDGADAHHTTDFEARVLALIERERISIIIANPRSAPVENILPSLFALSFIERRFTFLDFHKVYEEIFDRVPLSSLHYDWFLTHVSQSSHIVYDMVKRAIDVVGSVALGGGFLLLLPFIALAIRLEGRGPVFIAQERMGRYNRPIIIYKLRTMTKNERVSGTWVGESENKVTRVGAVLRRLSVDEIPQVWSILKGDMALIGPRNDIVGLGTRLAEAIPYYNIRNFVKPGVTGWAQTHQHYMGNNISPQSIEESRVRLAYDLYYVKNRSLWLDVSIALRTVKTILGRFGFSIRVR